MFGEAQKNVDLAKKCGLKWGQGHNPDLSARGARHDGEKCRFGETRTTRLGGAIDSHYPPSPLPSLVVKLRYVGTKLRRAKASRP